MRHTVHVMFGRASGKALLDLERYILKYGSKEAAAYFTALNIFSDNGEICVEEAVPDFLSRQDIPFTDSFGAHLEEREKLKDASALQSCLMSLKRNLVNADHPGDFSELHYCLYVPLFDAKYWDQASLVIKAIDKDIYPLPQVDVIGFCADMAEVFPGFGKNSYENYLEVTRETMGRICSFKTESQSFSHFIALDNKQLSGVSLNLNEKTLIPILGEFALLIIECYSSLFSGLLDEKDLYAIGLATMSMDQFYFVEYLLRKTYISVLEKEHVNRAEVDYNKMSLLTQKVLSKWVTLMSDFYRKEVKPLRQLKKGDHSIVVEITPKLKGMLDELVEEVDGYILDTSLDIPEKKAFLAVLLGLDDPSLVNSIFNEKELVFQDLEREAIQTFIDANNALLSYEERKSDALLSMFLDVNNPEEPVFYPFDIIKQNRLAIKRCVTTVRELEKNEDKLKAQLANQSESEKCLIDNGVINFKGQSFRLLPEVVDPPLQDNYIPHKVTSSSVDLRSKFTPVRNQGEMGSCLSHAMVSVYEYFLRCNGLETPDLSELFLYYNARYIDGNVNEDVGATLQASMKSLAEQGICTEELWPYDVRNINEKPSDQAYKDALDRKVKTSLNVAIDADAIKSAIEEGLPVIISVNVYESFSSGSHGFIPLPSPDERLSDKHGRHALVICGYSDEEKVFIVRNSWGMEFGDSGYCYIPYAYVINSDLVNWAAIIKEIVSAKTVDDPSQITEDNVFGIRKENRSHVNFDRTDASVMLMATQASLAEQRNLLELLKQQEQKISGYYAKLKQLLIDKNLQSKLRESTESRLDSEIQQKQQIRDCTEKEKFKELKRFDKATLRKMLIGLLVFIGILVCGLLVNKTVHFVQSKKGELTNTRVEKTRGIVIWTLMADVLVLSTVGVVYLVRKRRRKTIEGEYNDCIEMIGVEAQHIADQRDMVAVNFFISGFIISRLFDLHDNLAGRYNILKSFQNNLITWYDALLAEDPNVDRESHPTSVTLLTPDIMDRFFEDNKDVISGGINLSDLLSGFSLTDDGIVSLKNRLENEVVGGILTPLEDFSIYRYLAKLQDFPYLPKVKDARFINIKLEELAIKSQPFLQMKVTAGALNPLSTIFINISDSELNNWNLIYPISFSIRPNTCIIENKGKVVVTNIQQLDLKDVLFM